MQVAAREAFKQIRLGRRVFLQRIVDAPAFEPDSMIAGINRIRIGADRIAARARSDAFDKDVHH